MRGLLDVDDLHRRFGDHEVVSGLDVWLRPGERVAFVGPNGSGKSTALRCVAGVLEPSAGTVRVGGHRSGSRRARELTGVSLSQERSFYLRISGRDNLVFFARLRGYSRRDAGRAVDSLAEEMEIGDFMLQRADEYSTGMILQVAFVRALLGDPPLLVLDEPTRSLDKDAVKRLWAALDRRIETALVMATHMEDDVARCGRSVAFER